jgi:hypothetical protein
MSGRQASRLLKLFVIVPASIDAARVTEVIMPRVKSGAKGSLTPWR